MIKQCKNPNCAETFEARGKRKYCSNLCGILFRNLRRDYVHSDRSRPWRDAPEFVAVDGEGIAGKCTECNCKQFDSAVGELCHCGHTMIGEPIGGHLHTYVLLGCGNEKRHRQYENPGGIDWDEAFTFLYSEFREHSPRANYVGYFLGYDFDQIMKTMPANKARQLLLHDLIEKRRCTNGESAWYWPVRLLGREEWWETHLHGGVQLWIRPMNCGCNADHHLPDCPRKTKSNPKGISPLKWLYVNDTGGTFKSSFLTAINPKEWGEDNRFITEEEYQLILRGKESRGIAKLDDEMRMYNQKENEILCRMMEVFARGLREFYIYPNNNQWYGPGQLSKKWLDKIGAISSKEVEELIPEQVLAIARECFYGGWFEIMVHGIINIPVWEYDKNSAYTYEYTQLPCLKCPDRWTTNEYSKPLNRLPKLRAGELAMVNVEVLGSDPYLGPLPFRSENNSIHRPNGTYGWYWQHEVEAAQRAGLIDVLQLHQRVVYHPCGCESPLSGPAWQLYEMRLKFGKESPLGKAAKIVLSSVYGKFAQSKGRPPYANPIYASLITSGVRTAILDAIATHPQGTKSVAMVATDGVYFLDRHTELDIDPKRLGAWGEKEIFGQTQIMPGVHFNDTARKDIAEGNRPKLKARGISARAFENIIGELTEQFQNWNGPSDGWPKMRFVSGFALVSCVQALVRGKWNTAGAASKAERNIDSKPDIKRRDAYFDPEYGVWRSKPYGAPVDNGHLAKTKGYDRSIGVTAMLEEHPAWGNDRFGVTPDGLVDDIWAAILYDR